MVRPRTSSIWLTLLLAWIGVSLACASNETPRLILPAFFVSPNGLDANDGSLSMPFRTLEEAQTAMQASSIKTTYLMGGTYTRSAALTLRASDRGETWVAYPGQKPVLDGGNHVHTAISILGDNISIRWLTIRNFAQIGIYIRNVSRVRIDSNTIQNIRSTGWNQGGIVMRGNLEGGQVTHNLVRYSQYAGIIYANSAGDTLKDLVIDSNVVYDTCISVPDCGAIHADDRSHATTGINITNNIIGNYGNTHNKNKAIYLDDLLSHTFVKYNIVYGTGMYALQIHGGDHNVVQNNIFDISGARMLGYYQDAGPNASSFSMVGNIFTCNIVYSSRPRLGSLWTNHITSAVAPLNDNNNLYWGANGPILRDYSVVDAAPTVADPGFVNPRQANYNFRTGKAPDFCGFQPIDSSHAGPLPNP